MKLYIKFMVSFRCKMVVEEALENVGINYKRVELGKVDLQNNNIAAEKYERLKAILLQEGLLLLTDKKSILIERVKNLVVEMVHYSDDPPVTNMSVYISEKLDYDYTYIANLFSSVTGMTIAHYILRHKIEKAKELISYNELNLTEISDKLHYRSVSYFSHQFKKVTGVTPAWFKKNHQNEERIMLEMI